MNTMDKVELSNILINVEELSQEAVGCSRWPETQAVFYKIKAEVEKLPEGRQSYVWQSVAFSFLSNMEYPNASL